MNLFGTCLQFIILIALVVSCTDQEGESTLTIGGLERKTDVVSSSDTDSNTNSEDAVATDNVNSDEASGDEVAVEESGGGEEAAAPSAPTSLEMADPNAASGEDNTPTIKVNGVASGDTVYLYKNSTCSELVQSASASGASVDITTGILAVGAYTFYATRKDSNNKTSDCSTANVSYTVEAPKPAAPTSLAMSDPNSNTGEDTTPTITVGGVENGDTVYLYKNSACSELVTSASATGSTINITTGTLAVGSYTFYATRSANSKTSDCSTANVSYTVEHPTPAAPTSLTMRNPIANSGEDTTPTITVGGVANGDTVYLYKNSSCSELVTSASATGSTINITTGTLAVGSYTFYATRSANSKTSKCSTATVSYEVLKPIPAPDSLKMVDPTGSSGTDTTPTVKVGGVESGDTVILFLESTCETSLAEAKATDTTIDLTSEKSLDIGKYSFYAQRIVDGRKSACSTATVAYEVTKSGGATCPTGYAVVPANGTLKTSEFCVMKYEAKDDGKGVPTGQASGTPWVSITQAEAKEKCTGMGDGYDLISNPEWLAIAYDIENTASNWSAGNISDGMLNRGHSDNDPTTALEVTDENDPYDSTKNTNKDGVGTGWEQKRTHTLSNAEIIWDFAGNVWEWTDWTLGESLVAGPTTCVASWKELGVVDCAELAAGDFMPDNPKGIETKTTYNSNYGLGKLYGGAGGAAMRGGDGFGTAANVGVYAMMLQKTDKQAFDYVGFRCVYRPPAK